MTPQPLKLVHRHLAPRQRPPPDARAPLLVLLHGYGSNEDDLLSLHAYLDDRLIFVSARAPLTLAPGSYAWYSLRRSATETQIDEAEAVVSQRAAATFVRKCVTEFDADPARVFLAGFSQGAMMTESVMLHEPGLLAGAVLLSGRTLPMLHGAPAGLVPPVFVAHGLTDAVVPIAEGRATRAFLESRGADLTYREYQMGHSISEQTLLDLDDWMRERL